MAGIKISDLPAAPSAQLTDVFPVDQGVVTYKETNQQVFDLFQSNGEALTTFDDTNVTLTLGGSPTTALLNASSITAGWTGQLSVPRGGTGNNSYTAYNVICAGVTSTSPFQAVGGVGTSGQVLTSNGPAALPSWQDTAVTPAALTSVNDTNVTVSLGGSPTNALLQATSMTMGWTGQLSVPRGGTGDSSFTAYAVVCGGTTSTDPLQSIASVGTSGQVLTSNGPGALPTMQDVAVTGPGGTNGQLQYNNSGVFGGDTVTTDGASNWAGTIDLTGQLSVDNLTFNGNSISSTSGGVNVSPLSGQDFTVTTAGGGLFNINASTGIDSIIDDDTMATATATNLATAESIVAYIASEIAAANQVVQYVVATDTTDDTSTSSTLANSSLTASITPTSATNRLLIITNTYCFFTSGSSLNNYATQTSIYRSSGTPATLQGSTLNGWAYASARSGDSQYAMATNMGTEIAGDTNLHTYYLQFARLATTAGTAHVDGSTGRPKIMIILELLV